MKIWRASRNVYYAANRQNLLSVVEMVWNLDQHCNRDLQGSCRFSMMPVVIRQIGISSVQEKIAVTESLK